MCYMSSYVSLFVHITLQKVHDGEGELVTQKHTHFYISNDKKHSSLFVQHYLFLHWSWLSANGARSIEHWVLSDRCVGQFKDASAIYFVARYPSLTNGCTMVWNYFASGHEKGTFCVFLTLCYFCLSCIVRTLYNMLLFAIVGALGWLRDSCEAGLAHGTDPKP